MRLYIYIYIYIYVYDRRDIFLANIVLDASSITINNLNDIVKSQITIATCITLQKRTIQFYFVLYVYFITNKINSN